MENELRHVQETRDQLGQQVRQTQEEIARGLQDRQELERRLDDAKQRLVELREEPFSCLVSGVQQPCADALD